MAEEQDDIEVTEGENGGGKSKLLIIIIAVLVLALGGVGAMMFLGGDKEGSPSEEATSDAPFIKSAAIYYTVDQDFNVNFSKQSNGEVRYLQIKLKVMARDQLIIDAFKLHLPAIQHEILLLLYGQNYDDLNSLGTKSLQAAVLAKVNELLKSEQLANGLEAVYFTSFLMQ